MNMKRLPVVGLVAFGVVLVGGLVYFFFFRVSSSDIIVAPPGTLFGTSGGAVPTNTSNPSSELEAPTAREVAPRFTQISTEPVAKGFLARTSDVNVSFGTGTSTLLGTLKETEIRYVEKETGNLYVYTVNAKTLTRIANQTLPGVVDVAWSQDGSYAFARYLSEETGDLVQSYALTTNNVEGYFLEEGLEQILVTPKGLVLTLLPSSTGSIATLANPDGTGVNSLFSSNLSALRLLSAGDNYIAYTKASAGSSGYVFKVDGKTGSFERLIGPLSGLTVLSSPSGKTLLVGYRSGNSIRFELFDVATRVFTSLPIATFPEKCAWTLDETEAYCGVPRALSGTLPDSWYQGGVSFSDRFWKVDVENRLATLLFDPHQLAEVEIDAVSLLVDDVSRSLLFSNKRDGSLWLYEL
jgi:hypothetical protein